MGRKRKNIRKLSTNEVIISVIIILAILGLQLIYQNMSHEENIIASYNNISEIPEYNGQIYVELNNNIPYFEEKEYTTESFERYSNLDNLGRCGVAFANICKEIMPKDGEERGDISQIKPTGWEQNKYDGEYLYNRCHLIGYQLSAENANELNLITGTRYFNVSGMLPFENKVAEYINENNQNVHVLYRVTPVFKENNLLASGVEIEAYSVEDKGKRNMF